MKSLGKLVLIFLTLTGPVQSFNVPAEDVDPWYYQDDRPAFWIPDKAQHFYGSQLLVESGWHPAAALGAGFLFEAWQDSQGIGFSWRDFAADALGVLAGQVNSDRAFILVIYSTEQEVIQLRLVIGI